MSHGAAPPGVFPPGNALTDCHDPSPTLEWFVFSHVVRGDRA